MKQHKESPHRHQDAVIVMLEYTRNKNVEKDYAISVYLQDKKLHSRDDHIHPKRLAQGKGT